MTHNKYTVHSGILSALILIILCVAIAAGVFIANARTVFADETPVTEDPWVRDNSWESRPDITGWEYGKYNNNLVAGEAVYGEVTYTVYNNGSSLSYVNQTLTNFTVGEDGLSREVKDALNELEVNDYVFRAEIPAGTATETTGGSEVSFEYKELLEPIEFKVTRATNSWLSTPNVVQWTWGSFSRTVNVFTAVPEYPLLVNDKKVSFGIYTDVDLDSPVEGLSNFTTVTGMGYGEQVDSDTARLLSALPAGTYYLNARSAQSDNYNGLSSVIQFTVSAARNYWTSTPQIVQWTWSNYNPAVNVISATAAIGEPEDVVYGIYKDKNCNQPLTDLAGFSFVKTVDQAVNYDLPEKVVTALSNLGAGNYYLKAEVAGTENYSQLASVTSFTVQKVNNYWLTTPSMHSWKFGSYDKTANALTAQPAFGGLAVISIYHDDGTQVLFSNNGAVVREFTLEDGKVPEYVSEILSTLGKGNYYVLASVADTDDYTGLNDYTDFADISAHGIELVITANANGWVTVPRVLGWVEGAFDAEKNKIFAEAACGNETMRITVLDSKENVVATYSDGAIDYAKLAKLDVGSYIVKFSVEGTNNYDGISGETTFAVTEDAVGLTGIIAAVVVFGLFDIAAAAFCIYLVVSRRRRIEESFRNMIRKELHRR